MLVVRGEQAYDYERQLAQELAPTGARAQYRLAAGSR